MAYQNNKSTYRKTENDDQKLGLKTASIRTLCITSIIKFRDLMFANKTMNNALIAKLVADYPVTTTKTTTGEARHSMKPFANLMQAFDNLPRFFIENDLDWDYTKKANLTPALMDVFTPNIFASDENNFDISIPWWYRFSYKKVDDNMQMNTVTIHSVLDRLYEEITSILGCLVESMDAYASEFERSQKDDLIVNLLTDFCEELLVFINRFGDIKYNAEIHNKKGAVMVPQPQQQPKKREPVSEPLFIEINKSAFVEPAITYATIAKVKTEGLSKNPLAPNTWALESAKLDTPLLGATNAVTKKQTATTETAVNVTASVETKKVDLVESKATTPVATKVPQVEEPKVTTITKVSKKSKAPSAAKESVTPVPIKKSETTTYEVMGINALKDAISSYGASMIASPNPLLSREVLVTAFRDGIEAREVLVTALRDGIKALVNKPELQETLIQTFEKALVSK